MSDSHKKLGWRDAWNLFEDVILGLVIFLGMYFLLVVLAPEALYFMQDIESCPSNEGWFSVYTWKTIATTADGILIAAFLWRNFQYTLCEYIRIPKICKNGEHLI